MNEITKINTGDTVMYLGNDELVIGKLEKYKHPYVIIEDYPTPLAENLIYAYRPDRLGALGIQTDLIKTIQKMVQDGELVCLSTKEDA